MKELDIKLGYQCNNRCVFCLNQDKRDFKIFPWQKLKKQILSFSQGREKKKLIISGGEPTISKNFFKTLSLAKKVGIDRMEIQTNGRMLAYKKKMKRIKKYKPVGFLVSFHYPNKKLYKKYSQADGFEQTLEGIRNIIKHNCNLTINTLVMKPTLNYLEKVVQILIKKRVDKMQFRFIDGKNVKENYKKFVPRFKKAMPVLKNIIDNYSDNIHIALREFPICITGKRYKKYAAPMLSRDRKNLTKKNKLLNSQEIESQQFTFPNCEGCIYQSQCQGVREEYVQIYGRQEFSPIKKVFKN